MDFCTADATAAGNIRIVEEIRRRHPTTPIVINSLLPRNSTELLRHNPYWKTISAVNHRLDCYAKTQQNVEFFNATDIFIYEDNFSLEDDDDNDNDEGEITEYYVNKSLMNDYLHPSGIGAMKWGQAIAKKVQALTEDSER